jgi:hypothetical protein
MLCAKPVDRHMVRGEIGADHPISHVLPALPLDPPRGPLPPAIRVQDQRHHHRRVIRRATPPIRSIPRIKHRQVHLRDHIQQTPRQMPFGQPLLQRRRHQESLLTINSNEVLGHARNRLPRPGQTFMKQPPRRAGRPATTGAGVKAPVALVATSSAHASVPEPALHSCWRGSVARRPHSPVSPKTVRTPYVRRRAGPVGADDRDRPVCWRWRAMVDPLADTRGRPSASGQGRL